MRREQFVRRHVQTHFSERQRVAPLIRDEYTIKYDELAQVRVKFSLTDVVFFDGLGYISRADECRFLSPDSFRSKATALDSMRLSPERRANWRL